jgi:small subunit ribosomal protein S6
MNEDKRFYEGMFLLEAGGSDFQAASEPVRTVLERNQAEVLSLKPWDERRLAYEIEGRRRGLYVLTYFKAVPAHIAEMEHDCELNEKILRMLVLRRDNLKEEEIGAETPATAGQRRAAARAEAAAKAAQDRPAKEAEAEAAGKAAQDRPAKEPDAKAPKPEAEAAKPEAEVPKPEAEAPAKPEAETAKPEAEAPAKPEAETAKPEAEVPKPKAEAAKPEAEVPKPEAEAPAKPEASPAPPAGADESGGSTDKPATP